jgi:hypothetical protein
MYQLNWELNPNPPHSLENGKRTANLGEKIRSRPWRACTRTPRSEASFKVFDTPISEASTQ